MSPRRLSAGVERRPCVVVQRFDVGLEEQEAQARTDVGLGQQCRLEVGGDELLADERLRLEPTSGGW